MNDDGSEGKRMQPGLACPCGSGSCYEDCCQPVHFDSTKVETAERLMRSRYSAFCLGLADFLVETTHPDHRAPRLREELVESFQGTRWIGLTIISASGGGSRDKFGKVEFIAEYISEGRLGMQRELSRFKRHKGAWKYIDGKG